MKIFQNIFFLLLLIIGFSLSAQDKVRFSDGKELKCKVLGLTDTTVWVGIKAGKKTKEEIIFNKYVFSVVYGDGREVVIYKPNTSDEKAFNVMQMRSYVDGASFARRNYKPYAATCGAFIVGAGGGLIGFWGFLPVIAYDLGIGSYPPRPKTKKKEHLPEVVDQFFTLGYQDVAQKKKAHHVIVGSIAGFASGVIYTYIGLKK